jgi:iron complex outermembrane recepter protein
MAHQQFTELSCTTRFAAALLALAGQSIAYADDPAEQAHSRNLEQVVITAQTLSRPEQAPSQGSLVATEPQSVIGGDFIQNNDSPAANYTDIIKFTPSVWTVDPNGPGLMENLATSIRGFQDGQFNVTFDGIPWGDSNDFTHHSTSCFMAQDLGSVVVDRGPGFSTRLASGRFDTGEINEWGGTRAYLDGKTMSSYGYLSNSSLDRSNAFLKILQPFGDSTTVSFAASTSTSTWE